jgi:hypothetical protein
MLQYVVMWGEVFLKNFLLMRCRLNTFQSAPLLWSWFHRYYSFHHYGCSFVSLLMEDSQKHAIPWSRNTLREERERECCYWMRLCNCLIHKELIIRHPVRLKRLFYILICSKFQRRTYTNDDMLYFFCWSSHRNDCECEIGDDNSWSVTESAHEGVKVVSLTQRRPLPPPPQEIFLVLIPVTGWVDHRVIVRPKGLCQWIISNDTIGNRTHDLPGSASTNCATAVPKLKLQKYAIISDTLP